MRGSRGVLTGLGLAIILIGASSAPGVTISGDFLFTDNRGPNPVLPSGHRLLLGATSVLPSGPSTTVTATHVPAGSGPDFTLSFLPAPQFPDLYSFVKPYAGETGQWDLMATDPIGSVTRRTHTLDDVRMLPLITGLSASGPPLAPHLTWDAVDPTTFPSFCSPPGSGGIFPPCEVGHDFFNYQVEVRLITGTPGNPAPSLFSSPAIATHLPGTFDPAPAMFDLPAGVLESGGNYLLGIRLIHNELEAILAPFPDARFFSPLENRSTAFLVYSTAVAEPGPLVVLGLGLTGLALVTLRRRPAV